MMFKLSEYEAGIAELKRFKEQTDDVDGIHYSRSGDSPISQETADRFKILLEPMRIAARTVREIEGLLRHSDHSLYLAMMKESSQLLTDIRLRRQMMKQCVRSVDPTFIAEDDRRDDEDETGEDGGGDDDDDGGGDGDPVWPNGQQKVRRLRRTVLPA